jgi:putative lipoic acid-binding regulatory protein
MRGLYTALIASLTVALGKSFIMHPTVLSRQHVQRSSPLEDGDFSGLIIKRGQNRSLPTTEDKETRVFEKLVEFPCLFQIKVIGVHEESFSKDILKIVSRVTGVPSEIITFSVRITGSSKYESISIDAPVSNADMLYELYSEVSKDSRVKFKF